MLSLDFLKKNRRCPSKGLLSPGSNNYFFSFFFPDPTRGCGTVPRLLFQPEKRDILRLSSQGPQILWLHHKGRRLSLQFLGIWGLRICSVVHKATVSRPISTQYKLLLERTYSNNLPPFNFTYRKSIYHFIQVKNNWRCPAVFNCIVMPY